MKKFEISGETKVIAILADPIKQVQTPQLMNRLFKQAGIDAVCVPFEIKSGHLEIALEACKTIKSISGAIITVPHKVNIAQLCDYKGDSALVGGAVNAVHFNEEREIIGDLFDGVGFVTGLLRSGIILNTETKVYLAGAGGAARGIAFSLLNQGVRQLTIYNRTMEKAAEFVQELKIYMPEAVITIGDAEPKDMDLCINSTSLGMIGLEGQVAFSLASLDVHTTIAEVIMKPEMTLLLKEAEKRGLPIVKGTEMLKAQISQLAAFVLNDQSLLEIELEL